ncbi:MAG: type II toxin-antitoxin system VapB family antitoxin [Deltaproteobacteria bacterium]|nr:type II toxin-antitoxin system VapB family antitoxin [Deltaproteobacteria bacterium]
MAIRTNIELDPTKVEQAKRVTGLHTTRSVIDFALARLTATSRALTGLSRMAGKVRFRSGYSYKRYR